MGRGYFDSGQLPCQGPPYRALQVIGDRSAILYALNAERGPMYVMNGTADTTMDIPHHLQPWFDEVKAQAIAVRGTDKDMFTTVFYPGVAHRPSWENRDAAEWLEQNIHFGIWTEKQIETMPTVKVSEWVKANGVTAGASEMREDHEGGIDALDVGLPNFKREDLMVLPDADWTAMKDQLTYEAWSAKAAAAEAGMAAAVHAAPAGNKAALEIWNSANGLSNLFPFRPSRRRDCKFQLHGRQFRVACPTTSRVLECLGEFPLTPSLFFMLRKSIQVGVCTVMRSSRLFSAIVLSVSALLALTAHAQEPFQQKTGTVAPSREPGLLFYLSGDHGFNADYAAGGVPAPNYLSDVKILPGGAKGSYLQCGDNQLLSYWAPGNIYAQRGTLDFDWRPREAVDETEFPLFRVGYADHSSWDMVWLRIDYNGHGFDAFVTDVNLGRTRISYMMPNFPKPDVWIHLTLAWDETSGICFYVNGKLVAEAAATGRFDAGLDQIGPHSRIISPPGVESTYSYDRGGDIDELRIYDRMLSADNIASLTRHEAPQSIPPLTRSLAATPAPLPDSKLTVQSWEQEWWYRYGWNRPNDVPALLPAEKTTVRKVEIHDAYDLKRWWWKGTDGIRETTWPGVYNRSTLPGRWDYIQLPDWDCYVLSGKSVTFWMPEEPWNHLEIEGGAWGNVALLTPGNGDPKAVADPDQEDTSPLLARTLFERPKGQERTSTTFAEPVKGEKVRFTNVAQEWPIEEFGAYYVHSGAEPDGVAKLSYAISSRSQLDNPSIQSLRAFIAGRYPVDERATMVASPGGGAGPRGGGGGRAGRGRYFGDTTATAKPANMPIVHILIPADYRDSQAVVGHGGTYSWENMHAGLDGIAIDLPGLNLKSTHGDSIPMNIEVKDPTWPMRDMLDFNFSVKPGEPHTLWLDTRDRILPHLKSLYITIASASPEFGTDAFEGAQIRLVFKPYDEALPEHISDRLTQVRDNYANMTEESVNSRKLNLYNRFDADITDLLRVDPTNDLGLKYWHEKNPEQIAPPFKVPTAPAGVPEWAFLQVTDLGMLADQLNWWIDNRQISYGDFGGGIGDDSDYLNWWPGLAMMGTDPDKLKKSQERTLDASFWNDMWDQGLAKGQFDELHAYEDGLNMLGEAMQLDFGSPKQLERAMVTAKRLEWLTGINSAGQRQIRSAYYSGSKMATGGVWGWAKNRSYFVYHPALQLVLFNGTPETRKLVLETADGFLAHYHADGNGRATMHLNVNFKTNEDLPSTNDAWFVLWAAYRWTGDKKYLAPFVGDPLGTLRQVNSDVLDMLNVRDTWGKDLLRTDPDQADDTH